MSRVVTPIRKNDTVLVISGKDRGKRARVLSVIPAKNRLLVEGVNMVKRTRARTPSATSRVRARARGPDRRVERAAGVPECGAQTRVGAKLLGDGRKVRVCTKCEGVVDK